MCDAVKNTITKFHPNYCDQNKIPIPIPILIARSNVMQCSVNVNITATTTTTFIDSFMDSLKINKRTRVPDAFIKNIGLGLGRL